MRQSQSQSYGMVQRQSAKMQMKPHMRQMLHILQLPAPELLAHIRQELEANPVLEAPDLDPVWGPGGYRRPYSPSRRPVASDDGVFDPLHLVPNPVPTLGEHLHEQLRLAAAGIPPAVRAIVSYMIGNLDDNGYLTFTPEEITKLRQPFDRDCVQEALIVLQQFDPAGIGARNLSECLRLQAERLPDCPPLVLPLLDWLQDVADNRIAKLAERLAAPEPEIREAVAAIKKLNPRPGAAFLPGDNPYVVPDVVIEQAGDRLVLSVSGASASRLAVNREYERIAAGSDEAGRFLSPHLHSARFLIKCMERRRATLIRVTQAIVEEQEAFFMEGAAGLKPMALKHIADRTGLHESTVSRATAGKYARTPRGVMELAAFFPSGLPTDDGMGISTNRVKARLQARIRHEHAGKPYSDDKLARLLADEGIRISRRTVAKYREELGIPSSYKRKREPS